MNVSSAVKQKYFNGAANAAETEKYLNLILDNFKEVGMVAFGQIKFLVNKEPESEADYNWATIDNFVKFAESSNIRLHYNTVINNKNSFPGWYWKLSANNKLNFIERHIKAIINRYKNNFYLFKLVNEQVRDKEENFLGSGKAKTELIVQMFKWAREASPDSLLMINDFGNFYNKEIRENYIKLINDVKNAGGPIDIIGLQSHMWSFELPSDKDIINTIDLIHTKTKLPIYISEFDISYDDTIHGGSKINPQNPFVNREGKKYKSWFDYQAYAYKHFFNLCKQTGFVDGFTFWGFIDEDDNWERPGIGLFDKNYKPKLAYESIKEKLK